MRQRIKHFRNGMVFGYPLCCVIQYSLMLYPEQAARRGVIDLGRKGAREIRYVPCSYCKGRHPKWRPVYRR